MDPVTAIAISGLALKLGGSVLGSIFGDKADTKSQKSMQKYLESMPKVYGDQMLEKLKNLDANKGNITAQVQSQQDIIDYNKSFDAGAYKVEPKKEWKDTFTVEQFLNPYMDEKRIKNEEALRRQNVVSGNLYGGGTGLAMLEKAGATTAEDWANALQQKNVERQFDYSADRQNYADIIANADRNLDIWKTGGQVKQSTGTAASNISSTVGQDINSRNDVLQSYYDQLNANSTDKAKLAALKAGNLPLWQKILTGAMSAGGTAADIASTVVASQPSSKTFDGSSLSTGGASSDIGTSYAASGYKKFDPLSQQTEYAQNYAPTYNMTDIGGVQSYSPAMTTNLASKHGSQP